MRVNLTMTLELAAVLGRVEEGAGSEEDDLLLRLLTPVTKAYTAKMSMPAVQEGLEQFGGQGLMEDTGLPGVLRDAQVLPIWEGTTNVLSHDVLRVLSKTRGRALHAFTQFVAARCAPLDAVPEPLRDSAKAALDAADGIVSYVRVTMSGGAPQPVVEALARDLLMSVGRVFGAAALVGHAGWSKSPRDAFVARRHALEGDRLLADSLARVASAGRDAQLAALKAERDLALDVDEATGLPQWCGDRDKRGRLRCAL